jgi:hypothetical protein
MGPYESMSSTLDVDWIGFWGESVGESNVLHWTASTDGATQVFEIERSNDALTFVHIGAHGAGNQQDQTISYTFQDEHPSSQIHFYRLKGIDDNGGVSYSEVIRIENLAVVTWEIYPNPGDGHFQVKGFMGHEMSVEVMDLTGKTVKSQATAGTTLDISALPQGLYFLKITGESGLSKVVRVVKR